MIKLGTNYGGWIIPNNNTLNSDSLIISVGVGEDISFDLQVNHHYNSRIILIDPTKRAIKHFNEVKDYYYLNYSFTSNIQTDYIKNIENLDIDFEKFKYIPKALWHQLGKFKFYKQENISYVSQSIIEGMFTSNYDEIETITFKELIEIFGENIDLLKLDIEGAEIEVLNNMLDLNIFPKYLLVEFDLLIKKKDLEGLTLKLIDRLLNYYNIFINDNYNITFVKI
jgi:FkbM family methyltransferase